VGWCFMKDTPFDCYAARAAAQLTRWATNCHNISIH
jgi:hypothetical protein